ncbi:MAG: hypothetical protein IKL38_09625 [Firmicutes bacterium]|nr:hypothetical protein [Bacillota bacterium]
MGLGDFFKKTFGKQTCAFCGNEVGMMKRTKIKNKEFICSDCSHGCSRFIQLYRLDKDAILGHMEYMKRQEKLYKEVVGKPTSVVPNASSNDWIEFYDDFGMFYVGSRNYENKWTKELFRYDQVAKYEAYLDEAEPEEAGKPKVFGECGVEITLVGAEEDMDEVRQGLRSHPYITETIRVCVNDRDKERGTYDVNHIITHFNYIFGVNDDTKGLFSFGPTKQQKREGEALKAMTGVFGTAIKAAKTGQVSEETAEQVKAAMDKVDDAATGGLAKYTRLADEAEDKVWK